MKNFGTETEIKEVVQVEPGYVGPLPNLFDAVERELKEELDVEEVYFKRSEEDIVVIGLEEENGVSYGGGAMHRYINRLPLRMQKNGV